MDKQLKELPKKGPLVSQIFTFGYAQRDMPGPLPYVKIWGTDPGNCRQNMFLIFGTKWSFQYDNEEKAGVAHYNLQRLEIADLSEDELIGFKQYIDNILKSITQSKLTDSMTVGGDFEIE